MAGLPFNFYAQWRENALGLTTLREGAEAPPEILLQRIWQHQRLRRGDLITTGGEPVRILHPGFWNREPGPDFRQAVLQLGAEPPCTGEVEIDTSPADWKQHGHDRNAAYSKVILHVVWSAEQSPTSALPTLALAQNLDAPLPELAQWLEGGPPAPENAEGLCRAPLRELPAALTAEILRQAALIRLQRKASDFQALARQGGWELALWHGLFAALGYKHNVWPMRCVAELLPRLRPCGTRNQLPLLALQARLFGVSGLLPAEAPKPARSTPEYFRNVWDHWWRERDEFAGVTLPRRVWKFAGLRPANHPQRRLALASHWLHGESLPARLEQWFAASAGTPKGLPESLLRILQPVRDDFWGSHYNFQCAAMPEPLPLLGASRVTDLAVNVILPWFWARATAGKASNQLARERAENHYFNWPAGEDNAVLKLARQRLFGGTTKLLRTAAAQQGALQIVRDFCDHSNALCEGCRFPELIRALPR